jgi:hypothetical protein
MSALRIYRLRKGRYELFATVALPLVCDFQARQDERYPIRTLDGAVVGEIRLAVSYYESSCWAEDAKVLEVCIRSLVVPESSADVLMTSTLKGQQG